MKIPRFFIVSLVSLAAHVCLPEAQAQSFPTGSNDFASAAVIDPTRSYTQSSPTDIQNYSRETGEPGHGFNNFIGAGKSAWWSFTPTVDSYCQVDTMLSYGRTNAIADTLLSVYTGTSVNALTRVAISDDYSAPPYSTQSNLSLTTFIAKKGTTYWIAADSYLPPSATTKNVVLQLRHTALKKATFTTILPARDEAEDVALITYTTTPQGGLSGKLTTRNKTYSFAGAFSLFGYYSTTLQLKAKDGSTQALYLQVDGSQAHEVTLMPSSTPQRPGNLVQSSTALEKKVFTVQNAPDVVGTFNCHLNRFALSGGFLILKIKSNGTISGVGNGPDGTAITVSSFIGEKYDETENPFHLFKSFSGGKGYFFSFCGFYEQNGVKKISAPASVYYRAPSSGAFYPAGIYEEMILLGAPYTKPAAKTLPLNFLHKSGNGVLVIDQALPELAANLSEGLTITNKYKVVFSDLTRKPTLKLNPATGLFTGSILLPNGKKSTLKGLLLDNGDNNVLGYATGTTMNLKLSIFDPG